jgi:hypothetical protein
MSLLKNLPVVFFKNSILIKNNRFRLHARLLKYNDFVTEYHLVPLLILDISNRLCSFGWMTLKLVKYSYMRI